MAAQTMMTWMVLTESVRDYIAKHGWPNLSLEQRQQLVKALEFDIAQSKQLQGSLPLDENRRIGVEIAEAEQGLHGLTSI